MRGDAKLMDIEEGKTPTVKETNKNILKYSFFSFLFLTIFESI